MAAPQNFVSVSRRPPDVEDYIDILRRYRSWIIGPTFAGLVISVVVAYFWPDMYVCSAAMQIRPSSVSHATHAVGDDRPDAAEAAGTWLEILGRDNLITLIQMPRLDLYPRNGRVTRWKTWPKTFPEKRPHPFRTSRTNQRAHRRFEIIFSNIRTNVKARAVGGGTGERVPEQGTFSAERNASSTSTLFDDLVKNAKDKWRANAGELATFTSENQGRLPENFQANSLEVQTRQAAIAR
jgi:hypothetical protein